MKTSHAILAATTAIASATLLSLGASANAADFSVNLSNQTGQSVTPRSFTNGPVTLSFAPSSLSLQNSGAGPYVASSGQGLCLYAQSSDSTPRCGVNGTTNPGPYNFIQMTSNVPIALTGGSVGNRQGTNGPVFASYSLGGPSLGTIPDLLGPFNFSAPIALAAGQSLYFTGAGTNSSIRVGSFNVSTVEVPGPIPLLGAATAFGWSRRIRKRIASKA